jgi:hypothetical protein
VGDIRSPGEQEEEVVDSIAAAAVVVVAANYNAVVVEGAVDGVHCKLFDQEDVQRCILGKVVVVVALSEQQPAVAMAVVVVAKALAGHLHSNFAAVEVDSSR